MSGGFLLVLEPAEAARLAPGWPDGRLLVARIGDGDEILSAEPLSEHDLAVRLRGPGAPPVHPPRRGSEAVRLSFGREAAVVAAAGSAARLTLPRSADPEPDQAPAPPAGLPVDVQAARAAGMAAGSLLRLVAGPDGGLILVPAPERPPWSRIPWVLRDVATAAALLGAFAAGLLA